MNVAICGFGRAAKTLAEVLLKSNEHHLTMVICRKESKNSGKDIGQILYGEGKEIGVEIVPIEKAKDYLKNYNVDVIIDFSHHDMAIPLIKMCGEINANFVMCTTNHTIEEISKFQSLSDELNIGIVYAPNLTIGINLLMDFVSRLSKIIPNFDFEIIEKHPKDKAKTTTTARMISQVINKGDVPIHSVRLNGYVGVHEVIATNGVEKISIEHESFSRQAFANGAILAANFILGKEGFYLMKDVIQNIEKQALEN